MKNVLIIEDDNLNSQSLAELVKAKFKNVNTKIVENVKQANIIISQNSEWDAVILDIWLKDDYYGGKNIFMGMNDVLKKKTIVTTGIAEHRELKSALINKGLPEENIFKKPVTSNEIISLLEKIWR